MTCRKATLPSRFPGIASWRQMPGLPRSVFDAERAESCRRGAHGAVYPELWRAAKSGDRLNRDVVRAEAYPAEFRGKALAECIRIFLDLESLLAPLGAGQRQLPVVSCGFDALSVPYFRHRRWTRFAFPDQSSCFNTAVSRRYPNRGRCRTISRSRRQSGVPYVGTKRKRIDVVVLRSGSITSRSGKTVRDQSIDCRTVEDNLRWSSPFGWSRRR